MSGGARVLQRSGWHLDSTAAIQTLSARAPPKVASAMRDSKGSSSEDPFNSALLCPGPADGFLPAEIRHASTEEPPPLFDIWTWQSIQARATSAVEFAMLEYRLDFPFASSA